MKNLFKVGLVCFWAMTGVSVLSSCSKDETEEGAKTDENYVTIGGVKWAKMNLGATTVGESTSTAFGDFYAWGAQETLVESINWAHLGIWGETLTPTFKSGCFAGYDDTTAPYFSGYSKYNSTDSKTTLEAADDVVTATLGSDWRMPTSDEFKALFDACGGASTPTSTTTIPSTKGIFWYAGSGIDDCNVPGMFFCDGTSVLFMATPGCIEGTYYLNGGMYAGYWSSTLNADGTPERLYFSKSTVEPQNHGYRTRHHGDVIRPVYTGSDTSKAYVTIGGVNWATINLGATSDADDASTAFGDFYAWGSMETLVESIPWDRLTVWGVTLAPTFKSGKTAGYVDANAAFAGSYEKYTSSDSKTKLETGDDIAHIKLGDNWRMPTSDEFKALFDACGGAATPTTTTAYPTAKGIYWYAGSGIDGYKVPGMFFCDGASVLFFPAPGCIEGISYLNAGVFAGYWSSTLNADGTPERLYFGQSVVQPQNHGARTRHHGDSVRPVTD